MNAEELRRLSEALSAFAGLLEAEWYNGNLDEKAYLRLNTDLGGIVAKYVQPTLFDRSNQLQVIERDRLARALVASGFNEWFGGYETADEMAEVIIRALDSTTGDERG